MEKDIKQVKILVCSVNAWNSKVGDNTFPLLLCDLPKENIASLCIREDIPDSPVCDNYFRISESKVLKSILHHGVKTGECVCAQHNENADAVNEHNRLYSQKQHFYYPKLFARELIWLLGKWKSVELDKFIDNFAPDIVLYEMSRYIHLNRIVQYILNRTGAKGVGCFWDDTFTYKQERSLGYKCLRFFQRKSLKRLAMTTSEFFAITPKTKREADAFFKIDCTVLTKPVVHRASHVLPSSTFPLKMLYTGNLSIGREDTVLKVVEALGKLNGNENKITLDIYTNSRLKELYQSAYNTDYSQLYAAVTQDRVIQLQNEADILLFVEALGAREKVARLSFSTKITDYYAAGKCIFAVGDADLAPMELFVEDKTAITATTVPEILPQLRKLLNPNCVREYATRAYETGNRKHSDKEIKNTFYNVLLKV